MQHPKKNLRLPAIAVALLVMFAASQAGAWTHTVYQGTLQGVGTVVLELEPADKDGRYRGRYFYPRHGVDIPLAGPADALIEPLALDQLPQVVRDARGYGGEPAFDHPAAVWSGTLSETGYHGRWTERGSGKTREFSLKRVASYDPNKSRIGPAEAVGVADGNRMIIMIDMANAPYETLKLRGHATAVGEEIGDERVGYRMWRDPRTQFKYPRLSRHPDPAVLARVNTLLEQRHWQMSKEALECVDMRYIDNFPAAGSLGDYDQESIVVDYLSTTLMSLHESGSLYCGGAHPNNHYDPFVLDLVRGEYLDWNRIIDGFVPGKYGYPEASPALVAFMDKARRDPRYVDPVELAEPQGNDDDLPSCTGIWPQYMALGLEQPGKLVFSISGIGHASGYCLGPHMSVPFRDLQPILKPAAARYLHPQR